MMRTNRLLSIRGSRSASSYINKARHNVYMPETAMLTNNGTHRFEHKGWEYSAYLGFVGGPILLYVGLTNVPETDSEVFARNEAYAIRKAEGKVKYKVTNRTHGHISSQYTYEKAGVGERPALQE